MAAFPEIEIQTPSLALLVQEPDADAQQHRKDENMKAIALDDPTPCAPAAIARELALTAAKCIEQGRHDSAAWRLADALALLHGTANDLPSIDHPTKRGGVLSATGVRHD